MKIWEGAAVRARKKVRSGGVGFYTRDVFCLECVELLMLLAGLVCRETPGSQARQVVLIVISNMSIK